MNMNQGKLLCSNLADNLVGLPSSPWDRMHWIKKWVAKNILYLLWKLYNIKLDELWEIYNPIVDVKGYQKIVEWVKRAKLKANFHGLKNLPDDGKFIMASTHNHGLPEALLSMNQLIKSYWGAHILGTRHAKVLRHDSEERVVTRVDFSKAEGEKVWNRMYDDIQSNFDKNHPLLIYPAGDISQKRGGEVSDLRRSWSFVLLAQRYWVPIVPVKITTESSNPFYEGLHPSKWVFKYLEKTYLWWLRKGKYMLNEVIERKDKPVEFHIWEPIYLDNATTFEKKTPWWRNILSNEVERIRKETYALGK